MSASLYLATPSGVGRFWVVLALVLAVTLSATACAPLPSKVLVLWHSLDGARAQALEALIDRWNAANPYGIVVVPERRSPARQHRAMLEGTVNGRLPDIALVTPAQASIYAQRGALIELDALVNNDDPALGWTAADRQDLYPFVLHAGRDARGRLFGVPQGGRAQVVLVNQNLLQVAGLPAWPESLSALREACTKATDVNLGTVCFGVASDSETFETWALAHGAQLYGGEGLQLGAAPVGAALQFLLDATRSGQAYRTLSQSRAVADFATGRVLFVLLWSTDLEAALREAQSRAPIDLAVGVLPPPQGQAPATLAQAPLWVIPAKRGGRPGLAWLVVRWFLDAEQTARYAEQTGELPARASATEKLNEESKPIHPLRQAMLRQLGSAARPEPMVSGWGCVREQLAAALRRVLSAEEGIPEVLLDVQAAAQRVLLEDCTAE